VKDWGLYLISIEIGIAIAIGIGLELCASVKLDIFCFLIPYHCDPDSDPDFDLDKACPNIMLCAMVTCDCHGWFPDIAGQTACETPGGTGEFEVDIERIRDNLEFTLMGTLGVRKVR
jgi:hypothetical protein